jgi:hypothetical protein
MILVSVRKKNGTDTNMKTECVVTTNNDLQIVSVLSAVTIRGCYNMFLRHTETHLVPSPITIRGSSLKHKL